MKLNPYLIPYTKINSKWIQKVNVRVKTIKLFKRNIDALLSDLELGNSFLDMTPKHKQTRKNG